MNTFARIHAARRSFTRVSLSHSPAAAADFRAARRRALVGVWSVDPVSGRLVWSWSERSSGESRSGGSETGDGAGSTIRLAA